VGDTVGTFEGALVGVGVGLIAIYVGSKEGENVGAGDGFIVG